MTEVEWLIESSDPETMLRRSTHGQEPPPLRKLRLFTAASLRYLTRRGHPPMSEKQLEATIRDLQNTVVHAERETHGGRLRRERREVGEVVVAAFLKELLGGEA